MAPVSSVAAFLAAARGPGPSAREAAEILGGLDGDARAVADAQAVAAAHRLAWMEARTGRPWSAAELARAEARAFVAIRRALQARGLWRA